MSTRSYVGGYTSTNTIQMSYCHSDGSPEDLGNHLLNEWNKWGRDTSKIIIFLGSHGGWSSLCDQNFDLAPESMTDNRAARNWHGLAPVFYDAKWDNLEVEGTPHIVTVEYDVTDKLHTTIRESEALEGFIDDASYVYIFNPHTNTLNCHTNMMDILDNIPNDGIKFDEYQFEDDEA